MKDEIYIQGLINGDTKILKEIYQSFFPGIRQHVVTAFGTSQDAEDVFQDALIVLYRQLKSEQLTLTSSFHTYLFSVAKRIWLKKQSRKRKIAVRSSAISTAANIDSEIENQLEITEQNRFIREKFDLLGDACQQVLNLFFEGKSMSKIAKAMGYGSENYARKRKLKCKNKLIDFIKEDNRFLEFKLK